MHIFYFFMKRIFEHLAKKIEDLKKSITGKTPLDLSKIERSRISILKEFENVISALEKKRNLIRDAFIKKTALKKYKIGVFRMLRYVKLRWILAAPFIYAMIFPTLLFHICLELYQQTAFRLCKISRVKASDHFAFDRQHLAYLNWLEKWNCFYCSYYNGLMSYAREIGGRTERYWCPIKHAKRVWDPHGQYEYFFEYLDAENYRKNHGKVRNEFEEK